MRSVAQILLFLGLMFLPLSQAAADAFIVGNFSLARTGDGAHWSLAARVPPSFKPPMDPIWPSRCHGTSQGQEIMGRELVLNYEVECAGEPQEGEKILIPWPLDGAHLEVITAGSTAAAVSATLPNAPDGILLPMNIAQAEEHASFAVAWRFIKLGMEHILTGWDHLCFLFCLCMLVPVRSLLILVTAFTVGHSISLSLAFLGLVDVPAPPIEALIALSIALLAREALVKDRRQGSFAGAPDRHHWWSYAFTVTGFGLVHGLGFASALNEIGVSPVLRILGLASFNVGVEMGQLCFVTGVIVTLAIMRRIAFERIFRFAGLAGAGSIGTFWMIQRLLEFVA